MFFWSARLRRAVASSFSTPSSRACYPNGFGPGARGPPSRKQRGFGGSPACQSTGWRRQAGHPWLGIVPTAKRVGTKPAATAQKGFCDFSNTPFCLAPKLHAKAETSKGRSRQERKEANPEYDIPLHDLCREDGMSRQCCHVHGP